MDTDTSSEENTSSDCSTDSSDDDRLETAQIGDVRLQIPQGLCERQELFQKVFSAHTWNSLSESSRQHLRKFLPNFPENDDREKANSLQRLFNGSDFRFGTNQLLQFHDHLKAGHFSPDIAKMRQMIRKAEGLEAKQRYRSYKEQLKRDVLESRRKLLNVVRNLPPGVEPKVEKTGSVPSAMDPLVHRTKRRYFQELAAIKAHVDETGFSSDENYPEGPPVAPSRKQKRHLNSIRNSVMMNGEKIYISTVATKAVGIDLERYITPNQNPFLLNDESYRTLLSQHKRRKLDCPKDEELITKTITLSDVVQRTQLPYIKKLSPLPTPVPKTQVKLKKKIKMEPNPILSNTEDSDSDAYSVLSSNSVRNRVKAKVTKKVKVKHEVLSDVKVEKVVEPLKIAPPPPPPPTAPTSGFTDLDGIDMMNLPIDLEDSNIDILELNNKPELMQETHANFLSLIRDIICSTSDHRMNMKTLEERLKTWQENPISPLNDWYSFSDNWVGVLQSAVNFLSGNLQELPEDFVPYIEYKQHLDVYQWIGAGRDTDAHLTPLAQYWLEHRNEVKHSITAKPLSSPVKPPTQQIQQQLEEIDVEVVDRSQTPPPPRCPTNWTVRKADNEEIKSFREQERRRYDNPHKAFTYRCNGYESVVGPLKGIYNPSVGNTKARGHTMLSADRPNFVTILSLVRDATARLPNGEGTRADICELLKSSQYISKDAPDNVLQSVVSGALDRMHTQFDPCVKYDQKRKIWIYLHRNRSEEDFERLHQQYQGMNKTLKKSTGKSRTPSKPKPKPEKANKTSNKISVSEGNTTTPAPIITESKAKSPPKPKPATPPIASPGTSRQTSILLPNIIENVETEPKPRSNQYKQTILSQEEKEINEALQAIVQSRGGSPIAKHITNPKTGKSLVKIISPNQGKSLIIPSSSAQLLKQTHETKTPTAKTQVITQQLLQTLSAQQKLIKTSETETKKVPVTVQQQILQNIKNVTLLRGVPQAHSPTTSTNIISDDGESVTQQEQITHVLKQKAVQQQQVILKQKHAAQLQKQTSLLGQQQQINVGGKTVMTSGQTPMVAKVLTNAAGQVISVGSLLTQQQKQHGALQQGATLRVSTSKAPHTNIIQLTPAGNATGVSKQSPGGSAQFTSTQNNFITLTNQPKLVVASQTSSVTTSTVTKSTTKTITKTQSLGKFPQKVAQQLLNAKFISQDFPKIIVGQQQNQKTAKGVVVSKGGGSSGANVVRMVNTANLNLTHIGGKPVLLAGNAIQTIQGQNVILQTQPNASSSGIVIQNTAKTINDSGSNVNLLNQPAQVVIAPQLKVQQSHPQVVLKSAQNASQGHIVLGGSPVRLQSTSSGNTQRVVLASSGQGGQIVAQQILLPAGFQGAAINIKALQGVKVIPVAQAQHSKNVQGRQVFARLMGPTNIVRATAQPASATEIVTETPTTTE